MCWLPEFCWPWTEPHFKLASWVFYLWSHPPRPESWWRRRHWAGQTRLEGGVQPTLGWPWGAQGKWLHFGGPPEIAPARGQSARHWLTRAAPLPPASDSDLGSVPPQGGRTSGGLQPCFLGGRCCVPGTLHSVIQWGGPALPSPSLLSTAAFTLIMKDTPAPARILL